MILTLTRDAHATLQLLGSRFISRAFPATSERAVLEKIDAISASHPGATHHCFAFRIGAAAKLVEKSSDAGEPRGSAGPPILSAIRGRGLTNVGVVVTRFFGGTKLGLGRLTRAYGEAARRALDAATVVEQERKLEIALSIPLVLVGEVRSLLARVEGEIVSEEYGAQARLVVRVGEQRERRFREWVDDVTRGRTLWEA